MKRKNKKSLRPDRKTFEYYYYNMNVSVDAMAKVWGVTKQTIYNWAYQFRKEET